MPRPSCANSGRVMRTRSPRLGMLTAARWVTTGIAIAVLFTETTAMAAAKKPKAAATKEAEEPDATTPEKPVEEKTTEPEASDKSDVAAAEAQEPEPKEAEANPVVEEPPQPATIKPTLNWISLGIQQDFMFHSQTNDACGSASRYECFDGAGAPQIFNPGMYVPGGNQVSTPGAAPGTLRVLVGVDRVLLRRITVGLRLGSVIVGKAEKHPGDSAVMFFHAEVRAAYWFGADPFAAAGFRPYVFLSGGLAEADSKVMVQLTPNNQNSLYSFNAWKRSGSGFMGLGAGLQWAIRQNHGPLVEMRYMQFLGPSAPVLAAQLGYAVGF